VAAKERSIRAAIQLATSRKGIRLFANVTGLGYVGRVVERSGSTVTLANARVLHAGLVKGGSDLVGWSPLVITESMVGQTVAIFTAVEVKTKGLKVVEGDDQHRFITAVRRAGGRAGVAYNSGEAVTICEEVPVPLTQKRGPRGNRASSHVA